MGDERRVWCCATFQEILLIGEQIRIALHTSRVVRDQRYMLRTYTNSFIGSECVDWLIKNNQAPSREMAVILMNIIMENQIIHHVNDTSIFKDENQYYRFTKEDGTFRHEEDLSMILRGRTLYEQLKHDNTDRLQRYVDAEGNVFNYTFKGSDFVSWLLITGHLKETAVTLGKQLLVAGVIKHVSDSHHFKDEPLLYHFAVDYSRELSLMDLVVPPPEPEVPTKASQRFVSLPLGPSPVAGSIAKDIPASVGSSASGSSAPGKVGSTNGRTPRRTESGYHSEGQTPPSPTSDDDDDDSPPAVQTIERDDVSSPRHFSLDLSPRKAAGARVYHRATVQELQDEEMFRRRHIRMDQDPVGFGFVIRGEGPCFVKTVDPDGPAAKAGLKVGHHLYSVNDIQCLNVHHKDLAHVILASNPYCTLVVMERLNKEPSQPMDLQ